MKIATKENREIETDKRVQVYFNLHHKIWSVRQNGLVVAHVDSIVLRDPKYVVSAAGNKRVRQVVAKAERRLEQAMRHTKRRYA